MAGFSATTIWPKTEREGGGRTIYTFGSLTPFCGKERGVGKKSAIVFCTSFAVCAKKPSRASLTFIFSALGEKRFFFSFLFF